jgi:uncharacterized repeat protein (TIGR01451 family)
MVDMNDSATGGPTESSPRKRGILSASLRKRWVKATVLAVVCVNAAALLALPAFGQAPQGSCGGGSGSGFSGGSGSGCDADLSLRVVQSQSTIAVGQRLFYLMEVKNNGPGFAREVRVVARLPFSTRALWDTTSGNGYGYCLAVDPKVHVADCFFYYLDPGEKGAVIVVVRPSKAAIIKTTVGVSSYTSDPNGKNNIATITTTVTP